MLALRLALTLLVAVAVCQDGGAPTEGQLKDREALLVLKARITGYGSSDISTWRATGSPCGGDVQWKHVKCENGRVVELNLANMGIVGVLPVSLRKATKMEVLDLSGNRFSGRIPVDWANKNYFTRLRVLDLSDNELSGSLPLWNRPGVLKSLTWLDLSNNNFYGGLPGSWLGKYKVLRSLKYMDLSGNQLGTTDGETQATRAQWCETDTANNWKLGSGWCPDNPPLEGTAPSLEYMNLADNGLTGKLPEKWPKMFPRLEELHLEFNDLYMEDSSDAATPSALPSSWTSNTERGFPLLVYLTLYPGNDYLCTLPNAEGTYDDVNLDGTYLIVDSGGEPYGDSNPWLCPIGEGIDGTQKVTNVIIHISGTYVTWEYAAPASPDWIWGFEVVWECKKVSNGLWEPMSEDWAAARFRVYTQDGGTPVSPSVLSITGGIWTLELAPADFPGASVCSQYRATVSVVNLDNVESDPESATITAT